MLKTDSAQNRKTPAPPASSITRRGVFALAGAGAAIAAAPAKAHGFGTGFTHSVASGEPHANSVLLWTRFVSDAEVTLEWQVAEDAEFKRIASQGRVEASPDRDHCAKTMANGLTPDRWYFYRFIAPGGATSPTGRTRTLPEGPSARFRMAVFSCSNFGFGWFNAYAHAAEANDVDLAVHLGDYIYEYGAGTYPSGDQRHPDRSLLPDDEIIALADYRLRYASYRADPDLQRLHQVLPMIAVWDDHESANDSWENGAQNHDSETEGGWDARKAVARRVYREWMPVSDEPYAAYDVGDLATLFRLDTRLEGREEQFNIGKLIAGRENPAEMIAALEAFRRGDYMEESRELLGAGQDNWLREQLATSTARGAKWQVLVQQVLMGKLSAPERLGEIIGEGLPPAARNRLRAAVLARAAGLPLNMDAWDGYPAARDCVLEAALDADANLLVLAGDTHNGWAFDLAHDGARVGVELGVCSVSSPGFETYLAAVPPETLAALLVGENNELKWADTSQRGYMAVELTPQAATTEFRFVSGIRQRSTQLAGTHRVVARADERNLAL